MATVHGDGGNPAGAGQALPWQVHTASAVGAGHIRDGRPNQDSVGRRLLAPADGPALAVVVADGHGDSRHFRSARGSALAVTAGLAAVEAWIAQVTGGADAVRDSAGRTLVTDIIRRWDAAVAADLSADPFSDAEAAVLASMSLPDVIAYGSTLLVAAFTAEFAVFTQIGDGDIVAVLPDGQSLSPVPADDSLDGWQTTSLCQPDAAAAFRTGVVPLADRPLFAVLLATDGFGNAQVDDPWQPGFAEDLIQLGLDHEPDWFASQLPDWAAQCASVGGSGDDATMALVVRSDAALGPAAGKPASQDPATVTWGPVPAVRAPVQGIPGRRAWTDPAQTAEFASPAGGYAAPSAGPQRPGPPAPHVGRVGQGQAGWGRGGSGRAGRGRSPDQRPRLRLWWLVAAIAVILGGIGLVMALAGHSQPGPAPQPRPTHHTTHQPQPVPTKSHKAHNPHKSPSRPHPRHSRHRRQPVTTAARPLAPGAARKPVLTTAKETDR